MGLQPKADLGPAEALRCRWTRGFVFAAHECGNLLPLLFSPGSPPFWS